MMRIAFATVALAACTVGAEAAQDVVATTTYLRAGPGTTYRPLDEATKGRRLTVMECRDGWCRVGLGDATGYVAQDALGSAAMRDPASLTAGCFPSREAGRGSGRTVVFCREPGPMR